MPNSIWSLGWTAFSAICCAPGAVMLAVADSLENNTPLDESLKDVFESFKDTVEDQNEFIDSHVGEFNSLLGPIVSKAIEKNL